MTNEISIIFPAFIAGLLVLSTHVPLGIEVLKRGIVFIDLAIAQIAGLGALIAILFFEDKAQSSPLLIQVFSLGAALLGAVTLNWTEKKFPDIQEALIGCLFIFSASLALLLLGENPHGGEHMKDLLAGQILWVKSSQLINTAIVYIFILLIWVFAKQRLNRLGFYMLFALTVTVSVQIVGVYLVFASLILPAIASRNLNDGNQLIFAYMIGIIGLISGLTASIIFDFTTGPAIVITLFLISIIYIIIRKNFFE